MEITAYNSRQHQQISLGDSTVKIGRDASVAGWVIDDPRISELQLTVQRKRENDRDQVLVQNHGRSMVLQSGRRIHGGGSCMLENYSMFWIGETCFSVTPTTIESNSASLTTLPSLNGDDSDGDVSGEKLASMLGQSPAATTLIHWLQSIGKLQRSVGGSKKLFSDAAHAVFDPGGLDCGFVITCEQEDFEIAEAFISNPELGIAFDREVVKACIKAGKTVFHDVTTFENPECKLHNAVVASPIFDHDDKLVGVIYGSRCRDRNNFRQGIRPLEAQFIQVVAESATAGMVRLAQEAEAARTRVQFEQVFSPKLVETLQRDPGILNGHEREVTVMFCDMRSSSLITDQLPPRELYHMLGDVMDFLTHRIISFDGVVIDYFGDGLAAFWNAPIDQENHAGLAVKAGLEILQSLPDLNEDWRNYLGRNIQMGIGIHTGQALVGNSGSRLRMKYGPRGKCVTVASRIEAETRRFGTPLLISESTRQLVHKEFVTRRVFSSRLKGFDEDYQLFQAFSPQMDVRDLERLRIYEQALEHFENQEYIETLEHLLDTEVDGMLDSAGEYLLQATRDAIKANPRKNLKISEKHFS